MTLNATGPLSLGGSTVGQSVNLEIGRSATSIITLNDTPVRQIAQILSGTISMADLRGKSFTVATDVAVIGGGGNPGYPLTAGGGGQVIFISPVLSPTQSYLATVNGVAAYSNFGGTTANPGYQGGNITPSDAGWGGNGGSGGASGSGYGGGNGIHATYWDGSSVVGEGYGGGGAAGAGGSGGDAGTDNPYAYLTYGGVGGNGLYWSINGVYYGAGAGGAISDSSAGNRNGASGLGYGNYGSSGMSGAVIVSYLGSTPRWGGGSITYAYGRVFHTFSTSGLLTPL